MPEPEKDMIRVEVTGVHEAQCFRLVFMAAPEPGEERYPIEIMLHATQLVELLHKGNVALSEWQHAGTEYLLERLLGPGRRL